MAAKKSKGASPVEKENGWQRWRGEVDTRLKVIAENQEEQKRIVTSTDEKLDRVLEKWEEKQDRKNTELDKRVQALENFRIKVAVVSGIAGVVGGGATTALMNHFARTLFGG